MPEPAAPPPRRLLALAPGAALLLAVAALLQLLQPFPYDADSYFHLAVARLIARHGILHAFPWTPFSWLADHWADKELLFHLLLLPVASLPAETAAKIAGAVAAGAALTALLFVLWREAVDRPLLWCLAALASSSAFALRLSLLRPHVLALLLALLVTWAAARRSWIVLAAAAFAYPLGYIAWHTALVLCALVELARLFVERRVDWRPPLLAAAACAAGLLVHPNFPEIATLWKIQNVDVLVRTAWAGAAGFDLGPEFSPLGAEGLLRTGALPLLATLGALALALRRRASVAALAFALAAAAFGVLTLRSQRFIEYWAPFAVAGLALSLPPRLPRLLPALALLAGFGWTALLGRANLELLARRGDDLPPETAQRLAAAIPMGAQVFTCGWGLTGELLLALPERRFLVALDPVFFAYSDADKYRQWYALVHHPPANPAAAVRDGFGARYVLCELDPAWKAFILALDRDPRAHAFVRGPLWYAAQLDPP